MQAVTTIGLDIAKSVFQVHGIDATGHVVIRRQLKRRYVLGFFQKLPREADLNALGAPVGRDPAEVHKEFESQHVLVKAFGCAWVGRGYVCDNPFDFHLLGSVKQGASSLSMSAARH